MASSTVSNRTYGGYHKTHVPAHDPELTETGPGTPMGEYMRKSWHPVCLSDELAEVPKAIRILGEDLVAFRDRSGTIGVLHRHCSHRGTSLEFGIVQQKGIRCCYHGWVYDVDGTLLEAPAEPKESRLYQTVCQGAYPAFERAGLVFAYLGPPEEIPVFPEYDAYREPADNQLVAFSNIYPCNWLQVFENIMDHFHTALLHNNMTVASVDESVKDGLNFPDAFFDMPIMDWGTTRNGHGVSFIAGRRVDEETIWVRMSEMVFPDLVHVSNLGSTAAQARHSKVSLSRWHTPVDDKNCILFGWRHLNAEIDPHGESDASRCGYDSIDFLEGQVERPYEIGQQAPGDWDAITNQRTIAVHALETPATSDVGVFLCRKLLRQLVRGESGSDSTRPMSTDGNETLHTCSSDTTLQLAQHPDKEVDKAQIKAMARKVFEVMQAADSQSSSSRPAFITAQLDAIDGRQLEAAE